ncbi:MAG: 3-oxoacyl-ACP synthase III [Planctomycetota bacterium]|nr:MAG: 3-oxoacyl-ACP synthase III [Planctomycetota bacterium]
MRFQNVCLEAIAYTLPDEIVTSAGIEARLEPVYSRLRLPEGRLELMTGIRERRFWAPGTRPGDVSLETASRLLDESQVDRELIGALVHGSVCRDQLEPATACRVHTGLGLPEQCLVYDVSNACLGLLNGMLQVATLIELGHLQAGLVVGTENARPLVENTIRTLNENTSLSRQEIKLSVASLTIGSGSAAALLVDRRLSRKGNRLHAAMYGAHSAAHELCQGGEAIATDGEPNASAEPSAAAGAAVAEQAVAPLMQTDSERLLAEGVAAAKPTFQAFLAESAWTRDDIARTCCHQVGSAHRKLLLETLGLEAARDFTTYETLGNTGSVALPITLAQAVEQNFVRAGDRTALLGIGSGINVLMLGVEWAG